MPAFASPPLRHPVLDRLAATLSLLFPGDAGYSAYTSDVVLEGRPDAVIRPRSEKEIVRILAEAHRHRLPVTVAGGQTSLTGSSVALEGLLLATQGMDRLLDVRRDPETGGMVAVAEPGIFLGDLERRLEAEGWFYPPDPTSRNEACLGATVATNATGEDTLLYGPTRRWVRELRVVCADGTPRVLRRSPASHPAEEKATAGYYLAGEEIDWLIGSEGTLAVITQVTVDLLPRPADLLAGLAFFPSRRVALEFVVAARQTRGIVPRALELIDRRCVDLLQGRTENIAWPDRAQAAIVFKQEFSGEREREERLLAWSSLMQRHLETGGAANLADRTLVFEGRADLERLRVFRHRIPSAINETLEPFRERGGAKVATDWWVPYGLLPDFLERWDRAIADSGLTAFTFGHVGNGHPHVNFLCHDGAETARARALVLGMCREAVAAGGGVAGEHGLGKLKRDLLAVQCSPTAIQAMREVKRAWDPENILGRGNLFPDEDTR
jgi:FAD/FMN-containing dehydrogenase